MNRPVVSRTGSLLKYAQVAATVRAQVADGVLLPGQAVPSGAALSRATGFSVLTCRRALRALITDGVLVPGASRNARPRVPPSVAPPDERTLASAARALSASLAARRRLGGLTQPQLAAVIGVSVTTVGHAETGRLWQSRHFWERTDGVLSACGELLALHDAYRVAAMSPCPADADPIAVDTAAGRPAVAVAASGPVACVTITWADGAVSTVYPPEAPARSGDATPGRLAARVPNGPGPFSG